MADNVDGRPAKSVSFVEIDNSPQRNSRNMNDSNSRNMNDNGNNNGNDNGNGNGNDNIISTTLNKLKSNKSMIIIVGVLGLGFLYFYFNKNKSKKKVTLELPKQEDALMFDMNGNVKKELDNSKKAYENELQLLQQQMMGLYNQSQQQQMYIQHLEQQLENQMNNKPKQNNNTQNNNTQNNNTRQNTNSQRNKKEDDNVALQDLSASELEDIKNKLDMLNNKE